MAFAVAKSERILKCAVTLCTSFRLIGIESADETAAPIIADG
jgi:hypothetical protein